MVESDLNKENSDNVEIELIGGRTPKQYARALINKIESFEDYEGEKVPGDLVSVIAHLSVDMLIRETDKKYYYEAKSNIH
jgi:hypothetical protein|tara:strand:- start:927 stop:1166 length:240 start_codon:yes stop_codon:yes gene_type:complete